MAWAGSYEELTAADFNSRQSLFGDKCAACNRISAWEQSCTIICFCSAVRRQFNCGRRYCQCAICICDCIVCSDILCTMSDDCTTCCIAAASCICLTACDHNTFKNIVRCKCTCSCIVARRQRCAIIRLASASGCNRNGNACLRYC